MKQAALIAGLSCVGFSVGLAAFIGSRLSEQAIALMAGALFGMIVALPIGGLVGWAVKGSRSIERAPSAQPIPPFASLPAAAPSPESLTDPWREPVVVRPVSTLTKSAAGEISNTRTTTSKVFKRSSSPPIVRMALSRCVRPQIKLHVTRRPNENGETTASARTTF